MRKLAAVVMVTLLSGVLLAGCNTQPKQTSQVSSETKKKLVVGTGTAFYPMSMMDKNGKIVGYDIDLVHGLGEYLNMEVELQAYNGLGNVISALQSQKVDLIAYAITITEKRKETIDFSTPYLDTYLNIAVSDKYKELSKWEEVDKPGVIIGVVMGSNGDATAQKMFKYATIKKFEDMSLVGQALANKQIDALVSTEIWVKVFKAYTPGITILPVRVGEVEPQGIGVSKGNKELLDKVNAYLKQYKESGAADKNYEKWFINEAWRDFVPPKQYK